MVGRAVDTMVWSRDASTIPSMRAPIISSTQRWLIAGGPAVEVGATRVFAVMPALGLARTEHGGAEGEGR